MSDALARDVPNHPAASGNFSEPYETLRQRHIVDMRARAPQVLERLSWPAERLKAERNRRLRDLVHFAKAHSRWHRARLTHVDPDRVTEDSIADIPPMTKDDLMTNFDAISTDAQVTLDVAEAHLAGLRSDAYLCDRYHVIASGGSSRRTCSAACRADSDMVPAESCAGGGTRTAAGSTWRAAHQRR